MRMIRGMNALDELLAHMDAAVDASDDPVTALVPFADKGYSRSVFDAAVAEYAANGWSVYYGRKAGTWLRLVRARPYSGGPAVAPTEAVGE
jgi:hypothetical protein